MTSGIVFLRSTEHGSTSAIHETPQDLAECVALGLDVEIPHCPSTAELEAFLKSHGADGDLHTSFDQCGDLELADMLGHAKAIGDPFGASTLEAELARRGQHAPTAAPLSPGGPLAA